MRKKLIELSVLFTSAAIIFIACSNEEDILTSENQTNGKSTAIFNSSVTYGSLTDQDGNEYKTITIGNQTWMAENLRTTKYNDGTAIPEWNNSGTAAYCNYNNTNNNETIATYGRLYNWYAVNSGKLAPMGWHIPTEAEWIALSDHLGNLDGGKLKEIGTTHWLTPNVEATNDSGFTALPGGVRGYNNKFFDMGAIGSWWSMEESDADLAFYHSMNTHESFVGNYSFSKQIGCSVRCIKD